MATSAMSSAVDKGFPSVTRGESELSGQGCVEKEVFAEVLREPAQTEDRKGDAGIGDLLFPSP